MQQQEFMQLISPFKTKLFRFAMQFVRNIAEAEDIVQEVLIKVWDKRATIHEIKNIEAWCMRLTKNLSIDKLRSKHLKVQALVNQSELVTSGINPHRQAELNDSVDKVKQLISKLPEKQRLVIQLRDIEEMSYQEIAKILEISMDQVKVNLFRARKQIKQQFINTESYGIERH